MNKKILIVEDDLTVVKTLESEMKQAGLEVDVASDGKLGFALALTTDYDVIVLEIVLPKMDGLTLCRKLRDRNIDAHILMLSARADEFDRILGLETGADDYMGKPFSPREVMAKIKAVLRRRDKEMNQHLGIADSGYLQYKNVTIDLNRFEVKIAGDLLELTLKEYELLTFMIRNKGRVLSREILLDNLWGLSFHGGTRVVDVQMCKLRDKLNKYGILIKTVRGVGYLLEDEEL